MINQNIEKDKTILTIMLIAGLVSGALAVVLMSLSLKWSISFVVGLIILGVGFLQKDLHRYFLALLVLSLPFSLLSHQFFVKKDYFGIPGIAIGVVDVFLMALIVLWVVFGISTVKFKEVKESSVNRAVIGLIGTTILSVIFSEDKLLAVFGLVVLVKAYILFFYMANNLDTTKTLQTVIDFMAVAIGIQLVLGVVQHFTGSSLGLDKFGETGDLMKMTFGGITFSRVSATLVHPNQFANFLGLGLPLILSTLLAANYKYKRRIIFSAIFSLGIIVFTLTFSRTGWFHLITSTLVVLSLSIWRGKLTKTTRNYLVIVSLVGTAFLVHFSNAIMLRIYESNPILVTGRLDMARVAWRMFLSNPWFGVGINNYTKVLPSYDFIGVMPAPVHNLYLLIAAETGVFGFLAFVALIICLFIAIAKGIKSGNVLFESVSVGLAGSLCGFLVDGLSDFSYVLTSTYWYFWFLAGMVVGLSHQTPCLKGSE